MGTTESIPQSQGPTPMFKHALQRAARVAQIPTCSALLEYNEKLRPALQEIRGNTIHKFLHNLKKQDIYHFAMSHYKETAQKYLRSKEQNFATPMVRFTDAECGGEFDYDGGGYRREFYSEFFHQCACDKNLFIGKARRYVPNFSANRLDELVALGIAIVESILNGDCGFPYLHPAVFQILIGNQDYHTYITIEDVPDLSTSHLIKQICDASSDQELQDILAEAPVMDSVGWPQGKQYRLNNADEIVQLLANWSTIECRRKAIDSLKTGLEYLGFLQRVKDCSILEPLFVYVEGYSVTRDYLEQILLPAIERLEPQNKQEKQAKEFAIKLTKGLADEEAKALFTFITGSYDPSIDREELDVKFSTKTGSKLPESMTCFKQLILPIGNKDINEFKTSFSRGLSEIKTKKD